MPTAVISDIHANAVALRAVLADIDARGIQRMICLGDIIGYGPDPLQCIDMVRERCAWALMGNHDFGVLYEPTNFNPGAESAAHWTREQLDAAPIDEKGANRLDFLGRLQVRQFEPLPRPEGAEDGASDDPAAANGTAHALCVHASPRRPVNEYIFPDDIHGDPDKIRSIFSRVDRVCFCGHTHVPGVFTDDVEFFSPTELGDPPVYRFGHDEKIIINSGSVGQPRDHDPRASYAVLYADRVEFVRVEYDIAETADRIKAIPELHDWLGDRLFEGR